MTFTINRYGLYSMLWLHLFSHIESIPVHPSILQNPYITILSSMLHFLCKLILQVLKCEAIPDLFPLSEEMRTGGMATEKITFLF